MASEPSALRAPLSRQPSYDTVLFDLDGTLVDPVYGITTCLAAALRSASVAVPSQAELARHIGPPLADTLRSYGLSDTQVEVAIATYRAQFEVDGLSGMTVHRGMRELVVDLCQAGVRVGVATAKPWIIARRVLDAMELLPLLDPVAGPDLDEADAAKHLVIARALQALGHPDVTGLVMVGDRSHDVVGARHHGIDAIGVTWGFGSKSELRSAAPLRVVDTVEELRTSLIPQP